ncbi:uncharacterized protein (TIGR00297 family) [Bacillus mesophilus]|uniref:DUF92 domain-containing protein n=1 Tax=Bacillus mesophilus TaxID=1808955 RepID=A0A6M0Q7Y4_9BACI|nr:uncharacterized protein (TIGR00297 family) [Bacillus mesophilus]NEY71610.1 DUF92 domain-containing protein [Bacillus mesophilus]
MLNSVVILFILAVSLMGIISKSLTLSGGIAAFVIGVLIGLGFGVQGLILLGAFFLSSSIWSKYKRNDKKKMDDITQKGEVRDYTQVMANGAIPALCGLWYHINPSDSLLIAFVVSIAAANADTWASEIGSLSKKAPIHILTLRSVEAGTSGAISVLGLIASLLGSFLISIMAIFLFEGISIVTLLVILLAGFMGSIFDTIIGATIQAKYCCRHCQIITEKVTHCQAPTSINSGVRYINNEVTNFSSILLASILGGTFTFLF